MSEGVGRTEGAGGDGDCVGADLHFPATDAEVRTLGNGLEMILKRDANAPVVSVQAWVRTGSIHEGELRGSGVSHLVEHLVFKGTGERGASEIARAVQDEGGYLNAYTSYDRTVYWIDTPKEGLVTALNVLADLVGRAVFPEDEYEREKDVIRREIDMGKDDAGRSSSQQVMRTAFSTHPFREPVIGHLELFNRVTREQALGYYRERYVPNNMAFVVAGDIDPDEVAGLIENECGSWERGMLKDVVVPAEPAQLGKREAHTEFETELSRFNLTWRIPGVTHEDMPALDVLASVLGSGRSSRLFRKVREEQGLVHSTGAYAYTPAGEGLFFIYGDADPGKRDEAAGAALEVVRDLVENGVGDGEVVKAQKGALSDQLQTLVTTRGQASDLGSNWMLTRNLDFTRDYVDSLRRVSAEDVQRVAARYLIERTRSYTSLNPKGSLRAVAAVVRGGTKGEVEKRVLSNGTTLLLREDPRLPLVNFHAVFAGGLLGECLETNGVTQLLASTVVKGTGRRSAVEIADVVEGAGGGIGASAGNNSFSVSLEVMRPDFGLGAEVFADVLSGAEFPDAEVEREREVQLAALKREDEHLMTVAMKEARRRMFPGHAYAMTRTGTRESVAGLDGAAVRDFAGESLTGGNGVVGVFGAIDGDEVESRLEEAMAAMRPGGRRFVEVGAPGVAGEAGEFDVERDKEQAVLLVGFRTGGVRSKDRVILSLIDEACSDMASRLFVRIREELGLAYYVGATQFLGLAGGAFQFYLGTSPEQLAKAQGELIGEIGRLAEGGLEGSELARAKKTYLGKYMLELQSNASLAQTCGLDELFGFGYESYQDLPDEVGAVTAEDVKRVAGEVFGNQEATVVRVKR